MSWLRRTAFILLIGSGEVVFYSILNRRPDPQENGIARRELQTNGETGYANIIWALINTREFLFIQ